jgi:hypothetical protein
MKASMAVSKSEVTGKGLTNRTANDTADTSTLHARGILKRRVVQKFQVFLAFTAIGFPRDSKSRGRGFKSSPPRFCLCPCH